MYVLIMLCQYVVGNIVLDRFDIAIYFEEGAKIIYIGLNVYMIPLLTLED